MLKKLAILGKGKTGSRLVELAKEKNIEVEVFSTSNPPTTEKLSSFDTGISFLPGQAFKDHIHTFIDANIAIITGSTGFDWPKDIEKTLVDKNLTWIYGHNFSIGMNLIYEMIQTLSATNKLFEHFDFSIHEKHHIHKVDSPSGTALKWKDWLGSESGSRCQITADREGDIVGHHQLKLNTPYESITLTHDALDRKIFAAGALWAAENLLTKNLSPGLYQFEKLALKEIKNEL